MQCVHAVNNRSAHADLMKTVHKLDFVHTPCGFQFFPVNFVDFDI